MIKKSKNYSLHEFNSHKESFLNDVISGLSQRRKSIPSKYFYDEEGSQLFNEICQTNEYYLTRTELSIMNEYSQEMAKNIGEGCLLIEYGSGSGEKTRLLLDHLEDIAGYIPIDISKEHLADTTRQLNKSYPHLEVLGLCADFTQQFRLPKPEHAVTHKMIYFPGSTIGNFNPEKAKDLLENMSSFCNDGDGLLIGIDLKKNEETLTRAYNDKKGVTAAFNFNLLKRINRELGADFDLEQFDHHAFYNKDEGRVEMHLVSQVPQSVQLNGSKFDFEKGESIFTESSYKFTVSEFEELAKSAGLSLQKVWTDKNDLMSVLYLTFEGDRG